MNEYSNADLKLLSRLNRKRPLDSITDNELEKIELIRTTPSGEPYTKPVGFKGLIGERLSPFAIELKDGRKVVGHFFPPTAIQDYFSLGEIKDRVLTDTINRILKIEKADRNRMFVWIEGVVLVKKEAILGETEVDSGFDWKYGVDIEDIPDKVYLILAKKGESVAAFVEGIKDKILAADSKEKLPEDFKNLLIGVRNLLLLFEKHSIRMPDFRIQNLVYYPDEKDGLKTPRIVDLFDFGNRMSLWTEKNPLSVMTSTFVYYLKEQLNERREFTDTQTRVIEAIENYLRTGEE